MLFHYPVVDEMFVPTGRRYAKIVLVTKQTKKGQSAL